MEKGSLVVMRKEPHFRDIVTAEEFDLKLPDTRHVYTVSEGPYMSTWKQGVVKVIQLDHCTPGLELNAAYFVEIAPSNVGNNIKKLN